VRVLDFAWALVGSITTKTLGDLGADVVKIESRTRPDLARLDVQVSASSPATGMTSRGSRISIPPSAASRST
jgi:crotonobetainyl-CoA:carnitine CoA-transferase CaiB-like acyl-CoA transferase